MGKNKNENILTAAVSVLIIGLIGYFVYFVLTNNPSENSAVIVNNNLNQPAEKAPTSTKMDIIKKYGQAPQMQIDKNKNYTAVLKTSKGDITIELNAAKTPVTVNNFVFLAKGHFYDDTIFHRVINGFMIQGGDPNGDGTGGPGYRFDDEPFTGEYKRGTVAMANAGPDTNGSQFFIMHQDGPMLPKNYVIFGQVVSGLEAVDKIAEAPVKESSRGENSVPLEPVTIEAIEIVEK